MIYALDTEFHEDGRTIDLISIGIVAEDGRELYLISTEFDQVRASRHPWLREHVWPHLPQTTQRCRCPGPHLDTDHPAVRTRAQIARAVQDFLLAAGEPELWAYYSAYDHVALAQLWGPMAYLPAGIPMRTNDLAQEAARQGADLPLQESGQHEALADARHVMACLRRLGIAPGDGNDR